PAATGSADLPRNPDLGRLAKQLKSDKPEEGVQAAEGLGKRGADALPGAQALCEAALDPSESERQAAPEALENEHPGLSRQVPTLLTDTTSSSPVKAAA